MWSPLWADSLKWARILPEKTVDLLFLDPPYNLSKSFHGLKFSRKKIEDYTCWLDEVYPEFFARFERKCHDLHLW